MLCAAQAEAGRSGPVAILIGHQTSYRPAADQLKTALQNDGTACTVLELVDDPSADRAVLQKLADLKPILIAAGGTAATILALETVPDVPVVAFMIPNALDAPFMADGGSYRSRVACIASDPSPDHQMKWITKLHPDGRNMGVLYSARSQQVATALAAAGKKNGLKVAMIEARKDSFADAVEALDAEGCDQALMVPDAGVYNSTNVQRLLLWGIRQKKAVWGFSANVVKAGALAGQFSNSQTVGTQAAEAVRAILQGKTTAEIGLQFSRDPETAVNLRTAEMIGIPLSDDVLDDKTERFGETP